MATILDNLDGWVQLMITARLSTRARNKILLEEGIQTLRDFSNLTLSDVNTTISNLNKAYRTHTAAGQRFSIGAIHIKNLHAIHAWCTDALIEGQHTIMVPMDAQGQAINGQLQAMFDANWMANLLITYQTERNQEITPPTSTSVVTYNGNNWWESRRNIIDYLGTRVGAKGIPLSYLVRLQDGAWSDRFTSMTARRIACYRHSGPGYDQDNVSLYSILAQRFGTSTLNDLVRRFDTSKNGVAAWAAIRNTLEGTQWKRQLSTQANTMLTNAHFTGNTNNFGLEDYYKIHVRAHLMLQEAGEPLTEYNKIEKFMNGITDAMIRNDYKGQRTNAALTANFQAMYDHLNEGYRWEHPTGVPSAQRRRNNSKRHINEVNNHERGGGRGSGQRGRFGNRGRGNYRGRGNPRGGRGNGRDNGNRDGGRNNNGRWGNRNAGGRWNDTRNDDQYNMELPQSIINDPHNIADQDWYALNRSQKNAVRALRANARGINSAHSQRSQADDTSAISTPTTIQVPGSNEQSQQQRGIASESSAGSASRAADAFGSRPARRS